MLAALRQPRWWGLTLLAAVLVVTMIELGMWQLRRSHERADFNAHVTANTAAPAVPAESLLDPDDPVPEALAWRQVTVTGSYDVGAQVLIRNRQLDGAVGYDVVTPVVPAGGGPALLVDRGWVPSGDSAVSTPDVPAPPAGTVTVTARLHPGEDPARSDDLPAGQARSIDPAQLAAGAAYAVYDGYGTAVPDTPGTGATASDGTAGYPRPRPLPELSAGPHLGYAIQWWIFSLVAVAGWVILLRNDARAAKEGTRTWDSASRTTA